MSFTGKSDSYLEKNLENNGFFPDLSLGHFQRLYRVPAEYQQEKVEHLLRLSMHEVNDALADRQGQWQAEGHAALQDVSEETLGGVNVLVEQYQRAVFARATANAFFEFSTITRREIGENQAKESDRTAQLYKANADRALRQLLGKRTSITVELL